MVEKTEEKKSGGGFFAGFLTGVAGALVGGLLLDYVRERRADRKLEADLEDAGFSVVRFEDWR